MATRNNNVLRLGEDPLKLIIVSFHLVDETILM